MQKVSPTVTYLQFQIQVCFLTNHAFVMPRILHI